MERIKGDRRGARRFNMELGLRYRLVNGARSLTEGYGTTTNVSKDGLAFRADRSLPDGVAIEVSVDWPIPLYGRYPLELHLVGHVVRSDSGEVCVKTARHELIRVNSEPEAARAAAHSAPVM